MSNKNLLIATDAYKLSHALFYPKGLNKIYSYLIPRSDKKYSQVVFFGLQYYIKEYLSKPVTHDDVIEALEIRKSILGDNPPEIIENFTKLADLGYIPIEIKAVEEGTVMSPKNVMLTIENTHPDFAWLVGFLESLLLKLWYSCTVATLSKEYHDFISDKMTKTSTLDFLTPFMVHDFGYRGVSSEESAAIAGAAHLLNFLGTDTVPAVKFLKDYYPSNSSNPIGLSVAASEHSVMCSFGRENELEAFENMLNVNPTGIVSIVSDTYNLWNVYTNIAVQLKDRILNRDGKVVFRPDSGNPIDIICGNPNAQIGTPEYKGSIQLLDEIFGSTVNEKGYKELNPKIGLIYGDGMTLSNYKAIINKLESQGYAASNLVVGVGGVLLQQHNRDDLGFSFKALYCEVNGEPREIMKDPITDSGKKSHKGLLRLEKTETGQFITLDQQTREQQSTGLLKTTFVMVLLLVIQI